MGWSRARLGELLGGRQLADTPQAGAKVTSVQELEGAEPAEFSLGFRVRVGLRMG